MLWGGKVSNAKDSYRALSDDVLAELSKEGDEQAFSELVLRYFGRISYIARKYSARGYEHTDFEQEGLIGLYDAARTYDPAGARSFYSYALLCAERRLISVIRKQNSNKTVPSSLLVGLDALDFDTPDPSSSPDGAVMLRATFDQLSRILSKRELQVLKLYCQGQSYAQIAEMLGCSHKSVDNALQRVRRKCGNLDMS